MGEALEPLHNKISCPKCGRENEAKNKFCVQCGAPLQKEAVPQEQQDPLAEGLPDWNLEPPQTVIRRKVRLQ